MFLYKCVDAYADAIVHAPVDGYVNLVVDVIVDVYVCSQSTINAKVKISHIIALQSQRGFNSKEVH